MNFYLPIMGKTKRLLVVGDETIIMMIVNGTSVKVEGVFSGLASGDFGELAGALSKAPGQAYTIVVDILEQFYKKDSLPKVNVLDRGKVLDRKLEQAFPGYEIRGAFPVKKPDPKELEKAPGGIFTLAAVPGSDSLTKLMLVIETAGAIADIFVLLPVESVGLTDALTKKANDSGEPTRWGIVLGRHRSGGFRQIVVKDGELALTRMTTAPPDSATETELAETIGDEIKATLSYLSRLGYNANEGASVVALCNIPDAVMAEHVQLPVKSFKHMTPAAAARLVGLGDGAATGKDYSDLLHAVWFAKKLMPSLPLFAKSRMQDSQTREAAKAGTLALAAFAVFLLFSTIFSVLDYFGASGDLEAAQNDKAAVEKELGDQGKVVGNTGLSPKIIGAALDVSGRLDGQTARPQRIFAAIYRSMPQNIRVTSLTMQVDDMTGKPSAAGGAPPGEVRVIVSLNGFTDLQKAVDATNAMATAMKQRLPDLNVNVIRHAADILPGQTFSGGSAAQQRLATTNLNAEISIKGQLK